MRIMLLWQLINRFQLPGPATASLPVSVDSPLLGLRDTDVNKPTRDEMTKAGKYMIQLQDASCANTAE
eukprot:3660446-Rhodomonas_salina.2